MSEKLRVYHNPRCSKSRELVSLLIAKNIDFEIIDYLKMRLSLSELTAIAEALESEVNALIRTGDPAYKKLKSAPSGQAAIVKAIHMHPELMQRPIVTKGKRAVIARPADNVLELL